MQNNSTTPSANNFLKLQKLGQGSFGVVHKVKRISDGQLYAMKSAKIINMKEKDKRNALKQINMLASIQHCNIVNYKEAFFDHKSGDLCTIMELAAKGDLAQKIKTQQQVSRGLYQYEIWKIGLDIVSGLEALHQENILHRDIKPANIFFNDNERAMLGDLNVSTCLKNNMAYTQTGTPYYASPQVWNNEPYSFQCDIWSFGCVIYEMCSLTQPFRGKDMEQIYQKIRKCKFKEIPSNYSESLREVIHKCLSLRDKRISLAKLKEIFESNTAPKAVADKNPEQRQKRKSSIDLKQTIIFPKKLSDLVKILPQPKYRETQLEQRQDSIMKKLKEQNNLNRRILRKQKSEPSILDRFMKVREIVLGQKKEETKGVSKGQQNIAQESNRPIRGKIFYRNQKIAHSQKHLQVKKINLSLDINPEQKNVIRGAMKSPTFKQAISNKYHPSSGNNLAKYDRFSLQRLNLRRRKLRIIMNA